jgi:hypothetical protein
MTVPLGGRGAPCALPQQADRDALPYRENVMVMALGVKPVNLPCLFERDGAVLDIAQNC